MTSQRKLWTYLAAVAATCLIGLVLSWLFGVGTANRWWIGGTAMSTGWIVAAVGLGSWQWARTAVPAATAGIFAVLYVVDQPLDSRAWAFIVAAILTSIAHLRLVRRQSAI